MHTITFTRPTHAYDPLTRTFTIFDQAKKEAEREIKNINKLLNKKKWKG